MRPTSVVHRWALALPALVVLLSGCGEPRAPKGDPGGVPVAFTVRLEDGFVTGMSSQVTSPMYPLGRGYWSGYGYGYGYPYGYRAGDPRFRYYGRGGAWGYPVAPSPYWYEDYPQFTDLYLLAGDGPVEAGLFRTELPHGERRFDVPIRPGRVVTLTVQARGAREGWEVVGHFTAAGVPGQKVDLTLTGEGPRLTVSVPGQDPTSATAVPLPEGTSATAASATAAAPHP